jgi:hypothetical protein
MNKKLSTTQRIRTLIDKGHNNKAIIEKLQCKPQAVYNIRYQLNKERGLGSIGALPKPTDGIGAPPKKRTRRVKAGELASLPEPYNVTTLNHQSVREQFGSAPIKAEGQPVAYMPITMVEPKPTLWQRIKGWFRG